LNHLHCSIIASISLFGHGSIFRASTFDVFHLASTPKSASSSSPNLAWVSVLVHHLMYFHPSSWNFDCLNSMAT
jgi:hypothetical protein